MQHAHTQHQMAGSATAKDCPTTTLTLLQKPSLYAHTPCDVVSHHVTRPLRLLCRFFYLTHAAIAVYMLGKTIHLAISHVIRLQVSLPLVAEILQHSALYSIPTKRANKYQRNLTCSYHDREHNAYPAMAKGIEICGIMRQE